MKSHFPHILLEDLIIESLDGLWIRQRTEIPVFELSSTLTTTPESKSNLKA